MEQSKPIKIELIKPITMKTNLEMFFPVNYTRIIGYLLKNVIFPLYMRIHYCVYQFGTCGIRFQVQPN